MPVPQIVLVPDNWNDWFKYQTMYSVVLIDEDRRRRNIGSIKIGQLEMAGGRPQLDAEFTTLKPEFFSVGQDVSYYENVKDLGDARREEIHSALRDLAYDPQLFITALEQDVTTSSLLRSVSETSVKGQFRRLAEGRAKLSEYNFAFTAVPLPGSIVPPMTLTFEVKPRSNPPTNIHVVIGRNGVGKTNLLNSMVLSLVSGSVAGTHGQFSSSTVAQGEQIFANLVSVTFSAFDVSEPLKERRDSAEGILYAYIGLKRPKEPNGKIAPPKSAEDLKGEFAFSAYTLMVQGKERRWENALKELETDPIFQEANISSLLEYREQGEFIKKGETLFHRLSSGHKIVLLTITRLVETLEERSLVILDEPEAHLHPPLLSAFLRALSNLLIVRNAVAIIATHSPVVLQEVPRDCCWKLRRNGANAKAERLEIESFGENVGSLTHEVFGLEVTSSGFHKLLKSAAEEADTYEEMVEYFRGKLGFEAKTIARSLIANKQS